MLATWLNRVIVEEYEFEITRGEPLPAETLIPLPEMSYEQEVLNTSISFESRVAFLSEYDKADNKPTTVQQLSIDLNLTLSQTSRLMGEFNIVASENEDGELLVPALTKQVLSNELTWRQEFDSVDEYLSAPAIARIVSIAIDSVHELAYGLGVYPYYADRKGGKSFRLYPKALVEMIREYRLHFPPAGDWYGPNAAAQYVGKDGETWIPRMAALYGLRRGLRMSASNIWCEHYPQETLNKLKEIKESAEKPGGDWVTERRMEQLLNVSKGRLTKYLAGYQQHAERRLADNGVGRAHYPPHVLTEMKKIIDTEEGLKQRREDARGERRKAILDAAPPAEDWLTTPMVAEMLQRPRSWVITRLAKLSISSEMRRDSMNRPNPHYPPNSVDELQRHYMINEENSKAY